MCVFVSGVCLCVWWVLYICVYLTVCVCVCVKAEIIRASLHSLLLILQLTTLVKKNLINFVPQDSTKRSAHGYLMFCLLFA